MMNPKSLDTLEVQINKILNEFWNTNLPAVEQLRITHAKLTKLLKREYKKGYINGFRANNEARGYPKYSSPSEREWLDKRK